MLQVAAWDPANQRYNYFQRQPPSEGPTAGQHGAPPAQA